MGLNSGPVSLKATPRLWGGGGEAKRRGPDGLGGRRSEAQGAGRLACRALWRLAGTPPRTSVRARSAEAVDVPVGHPNRFAARQVSQPGACAHAFPCSSPNFSVWAGNGFARIQLSGRGSSVRGSQTLRRRGKRREPGQTRDSPLARAPTTAPTMPSSPPSTSAGRVWGRLYMDPLTYFLTEELCSLSLEKPCPHVQTNL